MQNKYEVVPNLTGTEINYLVRSKDNKTIFRGTQKECEDFINPPVEAKPKKK